MDGQTYRVVYDANVPSVISYTITKANPGEPATTRFELVPDTVPYMILPYTPVGGSVPGNDELEIVDDNALEMRFESAPEEREVSRIDVLKIDETENVARVIVKELPKMTQIQVNTLLSVIPILNIEYVSVSNSTVKQTLIVTIYIHGSVPSKLSIVPACTP